MSTNNGNNNTQGCAGTNIPQTDNSMIPCEEYIKSECITISDGVPYLGVLPNSTLTEYIQKLNNTIKSLDLRIKELENA